MSLGVFQKWNELPGSGDGKQSGQQAIPLESNNAPDRPPEAEMPPSETKKAKMSTTSQHSCRRSSKVCRFVKRVYKTLGLNHLFLLLVLCSYALVGAFIFMYIEGPYERGQINKAKEDAINRHEAYAAFISSLIMNDCSLENINITRGNNTFESDVNSSNSNATDPITDSNYTENNGSYCEHLLKQLLRQYDIETGLEKKEHYPLYKWDFWNSLFFAGTLFTTIGYGNMSAKTFYGRVATIIYATLGIPLMLTVLNDLGKLLFIWARRFWNCCRRCVKHRIVLPFKQRKGGSEKEVDRGVSYSTDHTDADVNSNFPLPLALGIVFIYTFGCATLFMLWEHNWDYFTGFYFFFVSLSTIGLGDVLPDNPKLTTATFGLFIIGLALVSMCINVIQAKVEARYLAALELIEEAYLDDELDGEGLSVPRTPESLPDDVRRVSFSPGPVDAESNHSATLGVMQVYKRPTRTSQNSTKGSKDASDSPNNTPRLKTIAEKEEKTTSNTNV